METALMISDETQSIAKVLALVVAKPSRLRNGLQAVLRVMPRLKVAELVSEGASAIEMVTKHHPALVILDVDLPDNQAWLLLEQIQRVRPQTRCLFFVNSIEQRRMAKLAGADAALLKGFGTMELFTTVEALLL